MFDSSLQIAILLFVLLLWAGAISLFYHQWGKIRGIDDYQPDYVHANMTIQHNPIPEETSDKLVCNDFFHEKTFTLHTFISCSIFEERWQ